MADDIVVPEKPSMPNVPPLAAVAVAQFVIGLLVAFGLDVNQALQDAILQGSTAALIILPLAEAWLRGRRATAYATVHAAAVGAQGAVAAAAVAAPSTVVQNAPSATGDATITTGQADPKELPPGLAIGDHVPVSDTRPYTDDDADADDREANTAVGPENVDAEPQPDAGSADEPSPTGDGEHPVKPAAAAPPDGAQV